MYYITGSQPNKATRRPANKASLRTHRLATSVLEKREDIFNITAFRMLLTADAFRHFGTHQRSAKHKNSQNYLEPSTQI